jgi:tRNA pseudouridine38-40 synthase
VQDHLQRSLSLLADEPIEVTAAGRTDAGVHASAQVVHFDTNAARDSNAWVRGTNSNLHEGARVVWACEVAGEFHARYSALSRTYRYLLLDDGVAPAILRDRVGEVRVERRGTIIVFTFRANAFLHHMIRNIVGSLVYVGAGKQRPEWIAELMEMRDRREAAPTFAAGGLYLAGVEYDRSFGLPAFRDQPLISP